MYIGTKNEIIFPLNMRYNSFYIYYTPFYVRYDNLIFAYGMLAFDTILTRYDKIIIYCMIFNNRLYILYIFVWESYWLFAYCIQPFTWSQFWLTQVHKDWHCFPNVGYRHLNAQLVPKNPSSLAKYFFLYFTI